MKTSKTEWNGLLICQIVFAMIGSIFAILGISFGLNIDEIAANPSSRGNVYVLPWVFGSIGAVLLLVSAILFSVALKQKQRRRRLFENGSCINATVTEICLDPLVRVRHRHPYYVLCVGANPYTGEKLVFKSPNMLKEPTHLMGRQLRVFVDLKNPQTYYVETERNYGEWQKDF